MNELSCQKQVTAQKGLLHAFLTPFASAFVVVGFFAAPMTATVLTVTTQPETSGTFAAGTIIAPPQGTYVSTSADPAALFSGQSVHFLGYTVGGSTEVLNGASLVYRFRLEFDQPVTISSIIVSGAAFNWSPTAPSVLRLLDENQNSLFSTLTTGFNSPSTNTLNTPGATGSVFYFDEFDDSLGWRFRSGIDVDFAAAVPEPSTYVLLLSGLAILAPLRHRKGSPVRACSEHAAHMGESGELN